MGVEVVRSIRSSGGHYTSITAWDTSHNPGSSTDLTTSLVFDYTGGTEIFTGETVTGAPSGATGTMVGLMVDGQIIIRGITGTFADGDVITSVSGNTTLVDSGDLPIPVAECYNDWPTGLIDQIALTFVSDATAYPNIRAAVGHRAAGILGDGFFINTVSLGSVSGYVSNTHYTVLEYIGCTSTAGHVVDTNSVMISCWHDGASAWTFRDIGPDNILINCWSRGGATGFEILPVATDTVLYNCSCIDSLTGFVVPGGASTDALLVNCMANDSIILDFFGTFSNVNNSNNLSSDTSAPGTASVHNAVVSFVNPAIGDYHLSGADIYAASAGLDVSSNPYWPFNVDFDDDVITSWSIGPDQLPFVGTIGGGGVSLQVIVALGNGQVNPPIIGSGGTTLQPIEANGFGWNPVYGGGGFVLTTIIAGSGQGYYNVNIGSGWISVPAVPIIDYPFFSGVPIQASGNATIVGHGQGHAILTPIIAAGTGEVDIRGGGGVSLQAVRGGYIYGSGGIKLRTNIIAGGSSNFEMFGKTEIGLLGPMVYRGLFEPKLDAANYAGGNVWKAEEHRLDIPDQYAEAIIAYVCYKLLSSTGRNNALGSADFYMRRYEHACRILERDGTANKMTNTTEKDAWIDNKDW